MGHSRHLRTIERRRLLSIPFTVKRGLSLREERGRLATLLVLNPSSQFLRSIGAPEASILRNGGRRYFNDLWVFSIEELKWEQMARPGSAPAPRGGCQLVVNGDALYLFGGHSVTVEPDGTETETVYDDMWRLDLKSYQVCGGLVSCAV